MTITFREISMNTEEKQTLVLDNLRLAYKIARKYRKSGKEYDDVVSDALCGLVEAAERFDPIKCTAFSTFASKTIHGLVKNGIRQRLRERFTISIESIWPCEIENPEIVDYRNDDRISLETAEHLHEVLDAREFKIVSGHLLESKTLREIGREIGLSRSRMSQIFKRAIGKLRRDES